MDSKPVVQADIAPHRRRSVNPVDIILIVLIALLLAGAVILAVRRKKTSPCCGNCEECMLKNKNGKCCGTAEIKDSQKDL